MKKKLSTICIVVSMISIILISSTMAYFTDYEEAVNVMVSGNVDIELIEQQRSEDGEFLEPFENGKELIPIVESAQGEKDKWGLPVSENYVDKIVTVDNIGKNDAYVRVIVAVPAALESDNASENILHWNFGNRFTADGDYNAENATNKDYENWNFKALDTTATIGDIEYNLYIFTYDKVLEAKTNTLSAAFVGFYLDSKVNYDNTLKKYTFNDEVIDFNLEEVLIPVYAQAVQASGFKSAEEAFTIAGLPENPWSDGHLITIAAVSNNTELSTAIESGATMINLTAGTYNIPASAKGKTLTITGAGPDTVIEVVPAGQGEANGQLDYSLDGSTVTFNNLTIKTNSQLYAGYARLSGTYNNCVIQNTYNLGVGDSKFNNCEFNITNEYLRVGGAYNATFNKCTFNTAGRAILVFQDGTSVKQTVIIKDCTFNASTSAYTWNDIHVAAVSIDGTSGTYNVVFEGSHTVDSDFAGLCQIKAGKDNVIVTGATPIE